MEEKDVEDPVMRIKQCIAAKKSMTFECIGGLSFLMFAVAMMEDELAEDILANGIDYDINESWDNGQTPLHCAAQMCLFDVIQAILKYTMDSINIYAVTNDFLLHFTRWEGGGKTVLHYAAASSNNIESCRLIVEFEYNIILKQHSIPKLLLIKDLQSNDVIDTALIYNNFKCAQWLYRTKLQYIEKHNKNNTMPYSAQDIDVYLRERMVYFNKNNKMLNDSKETKKRFEDGGNNHDAIINEKDIWIMDNVWSAKQCEYVLDKLIGFGNKTNWKSNRYQSFGTTDIALSMMDHSFGAFIRKELYFKVYPKIIKHYKFENKFEIGAKYLFFVRYNDSTEYRNTYDNFKQNSLNLHRDGSLISFNILLNKATDFEGGGTYFKNIDKVMEINQGDCCCHPGNILHSANGIIKGKRYILVGFLNAKKL